MPGADAIRRSTISSARDGSALQERQLGAPGPAGALVHAIHGRFWREQRIQPGLGLRQVVEQAAGRLPGRRWRGGSSAGNGSRSARASACLSCGCASSAANSSTYKCSQDGPAARHPLAMADGGGDAQGAVDGLQGAPELALPRVQEAQRPERPGLGGRRVGLARDPERFFQVSAGIDR